MILALKLLLKGMSVRGIAEVLGSKPDTVLFWLRRAAEHSEEVDAFLLRDLKVSKVELDELWTLVKKKTFKGMEEKQGEFWIWISYVPEHRLVLTTHVGHHDEKDAEVVVEKSKERLQRPLPLFVSDGWDAYIEALVGAFH